MTHELKIQKQWADAKLAGEKPFEIRRNDRGFQKGDLVKYRVVDPKTGERWKCAGAPAVTEQCGQLTAHHGDTHALEALAFRITYVIEGKDGLERGYCVFADVPVIPEEFNVVATGGLYNTKSFAGDTAPVSAGLETGELSQ